MASTQPRSSGLFSGLVLISIGLILLLHYYRHLDLDRLFTHWWPLLIIFWGAVKLYERTLGRQRSGGGAITGGEVLLVLGMFSLLGIVVAYEYVGRVVPGAEGDRYSFDVPDVPEKPIPERSPVTVRTAHGDITVRGSDQGKLLVSAKKNARSWDEDAAASLAKSVGVEIARNGDTFEVRPTGYSPSDSRISVDMEVAAPKHSPLTVKTEKGDVEISDFAAGVAIGNQNGDVEVRGTQGDVSIEMRKGDAKVSDTKGDVKISGKGGEIEVHDATGSLTVDGDFYGPVRAEKIAKGVRVVSARTELTAAGLPGHLEAGSGNLDLIDASGIVDLRTRDTEVNVENPGGRLTVANRNAQTTIRFSSPPKEDVQITNASGGISLAIPASASFEIVADCHNCDIDSELAALSPTKTESGDSHLGGKYGTGKGPKITLKTSYANIELKRSAAMVPAPPHPPAPPHGLVPPSEVE